MTVLIAGGGIGGLALALTCHQIGLPFKVFESVRELKPLGVGINLQPSAVRELYDLDLAEELDRIGIQTRDYGMYTKHGLEVWTEPRGTWAGYHWPQYSVHRGYLHMLLYQSILDRAGPDCVQTGCIVLGFEDTDDGALLHVKSRDGEQRTERGDVAIAADGIHSTIRKQMVPKEGEPIWGGSIMWRGTAQAKPFLTSASMVMVGHDGLRVVAYPISRPNHDTGLATTNWIAMLNRTVEDGYKKEDWSRKANLADFLPRFNGFAFDWLDVPTLIETSENVFEYPMVDRDPIDQWTHGRVTLMGDAAHAAYPVGSNGAGSAILDARVLGKYFVKHGVNEKALQAYEADMRPITSKVTLTNRVAGPDQILDVVEERCGGNFDRIEDVISTKELADHAANYKAVAGTGIETTNNAPRTIAEGAKARG